MSRHAGYASKWKGYYLEDCECSLCLYYQSKKLGCKLDKCCCGEEKREAAASGRINRQKGAMQWDG